MADEAVALPEGAVHLGTITRGRISASLADIAGCCWIYGLQAGLEGDPSDVTELIGELEGIAKRGGYERIYAESENAKMLKVSTRYGYRVRSVILEKEL